MSVPFDSDARWASVDLPDATAVLQRRLHCLAAGDRLSPAELIISDAGVDRPGVGQVIVGSGDKLARPLLHVVWHSPSGFGWGYPGSGPADLALSILHLVMVHAYATNSDGAVHPSLAAVVDTMIVTDEQASSAMAIAGRFHQAYKDEVVAQLDRSCGFQVVERYVVAWLFDALTVAALEPTS